MSTASYLDRFLDPITEAFTPELARRLVDLRADDKLQVGVLVQQPVVQTVFTRYMSDDGEVHVTHEHEVTTKIQTDVKCLRPEPNPYVIDEC